MSRWPRPRNAAARALGGALLLAAATCCGGAPPAVRPGPAPTAEELLHTLAVRQAALRSMNARARATSWMGGDRLRATVLMLVERTGRLRLEAEVSLQGTVSILTTQVGGGRAGAGRTDGHADADAGRGGGRFQLLDVRSNRLQQGPACPENVAALIRIPLAPAEVAAILLGDVKLPEASSAADARVGWDGARGADVLVVTSGGRETRVFFRPNGKVAEILGAAAFDGASLLWRAAYEDFADAGGGLRLPMVIRFAERGAPFDDGVELRFKDRTPNAELRPESFVITPPAGTEVIEVGCAAGPTGGGGASRP